MSPTKKEETNVVATELEGGEAQLLSDAIDWVIARTENLASCPFCGWQTLTEEPDEKSLRSHLRGAHPLSCTKAKEQDSMAPRLRDDDPANMEAVRAQAGLLEVNDTDPYDLLYVEDDIRKDAEKEGASLRWASPERVEHYRHQGAQVVLLDEKSGSLREKHADGTTRTREMVLIKMPEQLVQRRKAMQRKKTDANLAARREDLQKQRSKAAGLAYDSIMQSTGDRTAAQNVADAVERGQAPAHINVQRGGR